MKKVSKKKKLTENDTMMLDEQQQNSFSAKINNQLGNDQEDLSPIELMKHRIEEMNRKLLEMSRQRNRLKNGE